MDSSRRSRRGEHRRAAQLESGRRECSRRTAAAGMLRIVVRELGLLLILAYLGFGAVQGQGSVMAPTNWPLVGPALAPAFADSSESEPPMAFPSTPGVIPVVSPSPMIPVLPNGSPPKLSGLCPLNFSALTQPIDRTSQDCLAPLAVFVGEVICCPQLETLLYLSQGHHINKTGHLALNSTAAKHCFSDISSLLVSRGANSTVSRICSLRSDELTVGKCPVTEAARLRKLVNTTALLAACRGVDPLKECCRPVCQPALQQAAYQLVSNSSFDSLKPTDLVPTPVNQQALDDCKRVLLAWVTSQLQLTEANTALRNFFSCKINEACPLLFGDASSVIEACRGSSPSNTTCCQALHKYISEVQQQKLITNLQALECVSVLGSVLQKGGVTTNIYDLCGIYLKDFSLQGSGEQGCLLNSLPSDVMLTNSSGITFTCDLNDNIAAPWSPMSSSSLCLGGSRSNVSYPRIPQSAAPLSSGTRRQVRNRELFIVLPLLFLLVQHVAMS